jgi:hypothetical protein
MFKIDIAAILKSILIAVGLGFLYNKGKESKQNEVNLENVAKIKEGKKIEDVNFVKPNIAILDELRSKYTRDK